MELHHPEHLLFFSFLKKKIVFFQCPTTWIALVERWNWWFTESDTLTSGQKGPEALFRQHLFGLWTLDCVYCIGLTCFLVCFLMCSGQEKITIHSWKNKLKHLIIELLKWTLSLMVSHALRFMDSMAVMLLMLFLIHYTRQWFRHPGVSWSWIGFTCLDMRLSDQTFLKNA